MATKTRKKQDSLAQELAAALTALAAQQPKAPISANDMVVGIRNVSSVTIGLPNSPLPGAAPVTLSAPSKVPDPNTVAVISYPHWLQLRASPFYGHGLFVRDDSILGPSHARAPEDQPHELHPDHVKNVIPDPKAWIENQDESQLHAALARITSDMAIRRLQAAVDEKVAEIEARYAGDPRAAIKAVRDLPAKYAKLDELLTQRLFEILPNQDF